MTYSQKLRDPRWQKKRLQILERDRWACRSCGSSTKNLQVHHVIYRKVDPWDYPDQALQTLCDSCHEFRQAAMDSMMNDLRMLLMDIPNNDIAFTGHFLTTMAEALRIKRNDLTITEGAFQDLCMDMAYARFLHNDTTRLKGCLKLVLDDVEKSEQSKQEGGDA